MMTVRCDGCNKVVPAVYTGASHFWRIPGWFIKSVRKYEMHACSETCCQIVDAELGNIAKEAPWISQEEGVTVL